MRRRSLVGLAMGAPVPPQPLRLLMAGSMRLSGRWYRVVATGWPWIEVGGQYLVTIAYRPLNFDLGDGKVQIRNAMPAEGGVAGEGEWAGRTDSQPLLAGQQRVLGKDTAKIKRLLTQTPPDPLAVPYFALSPDERWEKVSEQR